VTSVLLAQRQATKAVLPRTSHCLNRPTLIHVH
jgi:hypothetical protein